MFQTIIFLFLHLFFPKYANTWGEKQVPGYFGNREIRLILQEET